MAQAKVITDPETFKPITLQITLETQGEVNALYALCNSAQNNIEQAIKDGRGTRNEGNNVEFDSIDLSAVKRAIYFATNKLTK